MKKSTKEFLQTLAGIIIFGALLGVLFAYSIKNFPAFYYSLNSGCASSFSDTKLAVLMSVVPIGVFMGMAALGELWQVQLHSRQTKRYISKKYLVLYGVGSALLLGTAFYLIQC
ncbi:MAG: hypothetical protein B7Y41_15230 [Hydrogenophilales bacterium 28-61-23]|nr:MAG: hypothetical protein B7Y41_15230 [Hydrogenophilales bacterium 28-61-23]